MAPKQCSRAAGGAPITERNPYWKSVLTGLAAQRLLFTLPPVCVNENQITAFLSPRSSCGFHLRPNKRWGLIGAKAIHLLSMPRSWLFTALTRHTVRPIFLCMSVSLFPSLFPDIHVCFIHLFCLWRKWGFPDLLLTSPTPLAFVASKASKLQYSSFVLFLTYLCRSPCYCTSGGQEALALYCFTPAQAWCLGYSRPQ